MSKRRIGKERYGYRFIAPFFIAFLIFQLYPIIYSLVISFTKWDGMSKDIIFVGLDNYARLIKDPIFLKSIGNTWIIWICAVIPQMVFAILLAVVLNDKKLKGKGLFRGVYYVPNLVTAASIGVLFSFLFGWQSGTINRLLMSLNLIKEPINWLISSSYSRGIISFAQWWMWFGYSMIIFMAGMNTIPDDVYESATIDGASKWQSFWSITMPLLKPTILFSTITSLIGGMQIFDLPNALTKGSGGPDNSTITMVMYLYNTAFKNYNFGYGAAIGYGLFILILVFSIISFKLINKGTEKYE